MELWYRTVRSIPLHSSDKDKVDLKRLMLQYLEMIVEIYLAVSQKCCSYAKILRTGLVEVLMQPVQDCLTRFRVSTYCAFGEHND